MPGTAVLRGPLPPPAATLGFCAVCAGVAKQRALAASSLGAEVSRHEATGSGTRAWPLAIPAPPAAVAWGVFPALGAALPLCWTHLTAIDLRSSAILPASPHQMPAGVPLLGPQPDGRQG